MILNMNQKNDIIIEPIKLDYENIRAERQRINNLLVYDLLRLKNKNDLMKYINVEELKRILTDLDDTLDNILEKCSKDEKFAKLIAYIISKKSSRQGTKDEKLQLETCGLTSSKYGIFIENLKSTAFYPTKYGDIISYKIYKTINKNDCLKSLDGKISGLIKGWIFSKIVFGSGGHQDNVFNETYTFCDWIIKYGKDDELYVVLIDTNQLLNFNKLKSKYNKNNLLICNHIEFQEYIISKYSALLLNAK